MQNITQLWLLKKLPPAENPWDLRIKVTEFSDRKMLILLTKTWKELKTTQFKSRLTDILLNDKSCRFFLLSLARGHSFVYLGSDSHSTNYLRLFLIVLTNDLGLCLGAPWRRNNVLLISTRKKCKWKLTTDRILDYTDHNCLQLWRLDLLDNLVPHAPQCVF